MPTDILKPGGVIGIMGGGQLGRMLATAAVELGYQPHIYCPDKASPAFQASSNYSCNEYTDTHALEAFLKDVDVVTFEFENIPHQSLSLIQKHKPVYPSPEVLKISQNRLREKNFVNAHEIPTTNYYRVSTPEELSRAIENIGLPAILKTTEMGYDGKGQKRVETAEEAAQAWTALGEIECVLEAIVDFTMEVSVVVARNRKGQQACYTPVQNIHKNHILDRTIAPAQLSRDMAKKAQNYALTLARASDLCGLLAVEMFITKDEKILVNELAPRPHNSGHWTMDACVTGQFEQHIRAICGLPLGGTERLCDAEMVNLIGDDVRQWEEHSKNPHAKLHLYGKEEARPGRKMGHVTILKA